MASQAFGNFDDLKLACIIVTRERASALPLEHTRVNGQITGPVASVSVTQRFGNPYKEAIELEYLFPLPHKAAVVDYEITIGDRVIRAEIKERETARQAYQQAIEAGQRASLLEERRPNLFSVQIGNVQPGETITATLRYQERLAYEADQYQFVFPMGVTPKYHANPAEGANVDSPIASGSERIGGIELTLAIDAGLPTADPISPSHHFALTRQDERRLTIALDAGHVPNKDFVLRLPVASTALQSTSWVSADSDADTVLITIVPPRLDGKMEPDPRQFIFVLDRSGSMSSASGLNRSPIGQARNALRACLRALGDKDTFMIQIFSDNVEWLSDKPLPITQANVDTADHWLEQIQATGGTNILGAIDAALAIPADAQRQRYVVFLTDGAVSADAQALGKIKKQRGDARIFTFGIGPSVNRALLAKMADFGRGTAEYLQLTEDIEQAITRFQDRISYPVLQDIELKWQNAESWDTYPTQLPDLFVGQPLELVTRLKRTGPVTVNMKGRRRGEIIGVALTIPAATTSDPTLRRVWARARVDSLINGMDQASNADEVRQQVIGLAIEHRLLTPYTAFVAVDSEVTKKSTDGPQKVNVAVPLPEDLNIDAFVGSSKLGLIAPAAARYMAPAQPLASPPSPAPQAAPPPAGISHDNRISGLRPGNDSRASMPIEALNLSVPVYNSLKRTGITTVGEVLEMLDRGPDAMLAIRNFGEKSLDELVTKLKEKGKGQRPPESADKPAQAIPTLNTIDERIKWLARTQNVSGSWGSGADEIEQTAAALLAFVRAGHTTQAGNYRRQVRKAAEWLRDASATDLNLAIKVRALTELEGTLQQSERYVPDNLSLASLPHGSDLEKIIIKAQPAAVPAAVTSLDTLRLIALAKGEASAPPELINGAYSQLVQTWMAVGKPLE